MGSKNDLLRSIFCPFYFILVPIHHERNQKKADCARGV